MSARLYLIVGCIALGPLGATYVNFLRSKVAAQVARIRAQLEATETALWAAQKALEETQRLASSPRTE